MINSEVVMLTNQPLLADQSCLNGQQGCHFNNPGGEQQLLPSDQTGYSQTSLNAFVTSQDAGPHQNAEELKKSEDGKTVEEGDSPMSPFSW